MGREEFEPQKDLENMRLLREALEEAVHNASIQLRGGIEDPAITPDVRDLCERHGYGNVIATASCLWRSKDKVGAFCFGPCVGTVERFIGMASRALCSAAGAKGGVGMDKIIAPKDYCGCFHNQDTGHFEPCCEEHWNEYVEYLHKQRNIEEPPSDSKCPPELEF